MNSSLSYPAILWPPGFVPPPPQSKTAVGRDEPTWHFLKHKVLSFYPYYLAAFLVTFLARQVVLQVGPLSFLKNMLLGSNEILLLYMYGIPAGRYYNGPTWYLSAMLIAMAILHPICKKWFAYFSSVGAPVIALVGYAVISQEFGALNLGNQWFGITCVGVIRAISGLSVGIFCSECSERIKTSGWQVTAAGKHVFTLIKFFLFGVLFCIMNFPTELKLGAGYDYIAVLLLLAFTVVIFSGLSGGRERFKNPERYKILSTFNLFLYLNHRGTIYTLVSLDADWTYRRYMFCYVIGTALSMLCSLLLLRMWNRFKNGMGRQIWNLLFRRRETDEVS